MNEVTQVHLDRQPFTVSVEAHAALKAYLAAIEKQVGSKSADVIKEVELRMAELLTERGITAEKVILPDDVVFLQEQLGAPKDFREEGDDNELPVEADQSPKRLFRDTENGMLAGVAAGLANYFGIDVVFIRILFAIAVLTGGWGIVVYILLWLIIPEAKTSSERLQMRGQAVTVDNLKAVVEKADIHGVARRANGTVVPLINSFFRAVLKIGAIVLICIGLSLLFAVIAAKAYAEVHSGKLFQENLFPVGSTETLLLNLGLVLAGLLSLFIVLSGTAVFRRKWPVKTWVTGILLGVFFVGFAVTIALAADVAPTVRDRYQAANHTATRNLQPFSNLDIKGGGVNVEFAYAKNYSVTMHYFDGPDLSKIKTVVANGSLEVDSSQFDNSRNCTMFCLFPNYNMVLTVSAPTIPAVPNKAFFNDNPTWNPDFYRSAVPVPPVPINN